MERAETLAWLQEDREEALRTLWRRADRTRHQKVGEDVHLRGLIEISNHCIRHCHYCGLNAEHCGLTRYRMSATEILECAHAAVRFGYGTVVLQAGEDPAISEEWMAGLIRDIKHETGLAVTLSLGERRQEELATWREAGADRYLLRLETSNAELFRRIHPGPGAPVDCDRVELLKVLGGMGYEVGSGVMIGIPGQSYRDLANDLERFRELDLDMIGVGPFIPHPLTPLAAEAPGWHAGMSDQTPNDERMTYKMIALSRLFCPYANIPSTTALATRNLAKGRELGLQRGANILMPNLTPPRYRIHYEIYPAKACIRESAEQCHGCIRQRIRSIGRRPGRGPGRAPSMSRRNT